MKEILAVVCLFALSFSPICAQQPQSAQIARKSTSESPRALSEAAPAEAAKLPVRRVVLYKNGVGYFEHLGRVRGDQDVHIDFTSGQLNDVLKSLTVLDLSGGRITGVDYNSEAPLARRLSTLRLALGERPSEAEFLGALRGARIEVRGAAGPAVVGKLLSVERRTRNATNWTVETDEISLVSDTGEVRSVDLNPSTSIRILDRDLNSEVGKYLSLIASSRDQDVRRMTISTAGTGERNLYVSYISEVPIWKTTYRIVLPTKPGKKPLLQGWAVVDNTVGEDWDNVELSLVAGAPHSFIQQLSQPYYSRRPVVPLPESVQLSPQTHSAALSGGNGTLTGQILDQSGATIPGTSVALKDENGAVIAQTVTDSNGRYIFSGLATGNYRAEIQKGGFQKTLVSNLNISPGENQFNTQLRLGSLAETVEITANTVQPLETSSAAITGRSALGVANRPRAGLTLRTGVAGKVPGGSMGGIVGGVLGPAPPMSLEEARESLDAAASGQGLGDLFEYRLKDRVTLKKNQSALVPIVQTEIDAEKVSLWSSTSGSGRPLRALWLKNTSPLTLDEGSFTVLEDDVFAGEGLTDAIKPGERRIISYATDLGLLVEAQTNGEPQHVIRARISKGVLTQISQLQQRTLYTVKNQDDSPRTLIIEQPARPEWKLVKGTPDPEERAPGVNRFRIEIAPKATASLPIEEARTLSTTYQISDLEPGQIEVFLKQRTLTPEMAQALEKITAQKAVVAKLEQDMEDRQKDIDRIVADQARLRENMKALRGSAEEKALLLRYTRQLDDQETQLAALRNNIQDTEAQRDRENDQLEKMIDDLQLDATL